MSKEEDMVAHPLSLSELCSTITIHAVRSTRRPIRSDWPPDTSHWSVRLTRAGKHLTTSYHMGSAHKNPPTAAEVMSALICDVSLFSDAEDLEEFARNLGMTKVKARRVYDACQREADQLAAFLGPDLHTFMKADNDV